jgi:glucose/arabinose dehydrogenase
VLAHSLAGGYLGVHSNGSQTVEMPASRAVRTRFACFLGAAAVLLTACGSNGNAGEPNWKPKPSFSGEGYDPGTRQPVAPQSPDPRSRSGSPSPSPRNAADSAVVATNLTAPTGIVIMPDGTALVGERTTGRIMRVQPEPHKPVQTVRTVPGLSTSGGGGLLDLAISPNYAEDNLIFAYLTTRRDNRVVEFTLKGPITPVLTGIPRGSSDNTGRLAFAADGTLLIGTGDAGHPRLAANPRSLAGKLLRVTDIGAAAPRNPAPGSRIYATGLRRTDGLCVDPATDAAFQTEARGGPTANPINHVVAGGFYGWPTATATAQQPLVLLPQASGSPGGCAVLDHVLYTTALDGKELLSANIKAGTGAVQLGAFNVSLRNAYGRLRTVVAAADGALWLTTSNRDGNGTPVAADERVLRIVPSGGSASSPL